MDINHLVKLTARAWSLPILTLMHRGTPGRQATLLAATGAGRTAFGHSLRHLIDMKLVMRTPGHGHPLRPEYTLTPLGKEAASLADRVTVSAGTPHALLRRAWTVPVLALSGAPTGFSDIKRGLSTVTDRALSQSLKQLESEAWIERDIILRNGPPRPLYRAVNTGLSIHHALDLTA